MIGLKSRHFNPADNAKQRRFFLINPHHIENESYENTTFYLRENQRTLRATINIIVKSRGKCFK